MSTSQSPGEPAPIEFKTQFVKSNFYRVVHADGAFGGITPNGHIRMAIYSEARKFPDTVTYTVNPEGRLSESSRSPDVPRGETTRDLEVDIVMTADVARSVRDWLDGKIKDLETVQRQLEAQSGEQQ